MTSGGPATFETAGGRVAAAAIVYQDIAGDDGPPLSLTATDGSGLVLARLDARAVVEGPLAFTELHLWFHNPEARVREGRFSITLPSGAALSRFAMENDGKWMEAEVVEKMAARRAYEDFLHRRQDPALLEKAAGNEFSARVFPIPAGGDKHLVVSYSQELPSSAASYTLPLRGLPGIARVDAVVKVARADRATLKWDETTLSHKGWKPDKDFIVPITAPIPAIASAEWLAARVVVPATGAAEDRPGSLAILVDTSASRALGFPRQIDQLGEMLGAIKQRYGGQVEIAVAAFDQDVLPIYRGRVDGWNVDHQKSLLARQPLGASSLEPALAWAAGTKAKRVVVFGDAVVTAGAEGPKLVGAIKALAGKGIERLDVALIGGIRDVDAARTWVTAGLPRDGAVIDLGLGVGEAARRLGLAVRSDLAIGVRGATWVWPDRAVGVQPGDELVVFAKTRVHGKATIEVAGAAIDVTPVGSTGPLLARAASQAEVARMERDLARTTDDKARTALRSAIVKRSVASRVLSSETAFLVLETEDDYARFGIPRTALADILVVGADGLRLEHRAGPVVIAAPQVAQKQPVTGKTKWKPNPAKASRESFADDGKNDKADDTRKKLSELEKGGEGGVAGGDVSGAVADPGPAPAAEPPPPPPPPQPTTTPRPPSGPSGGAHAGSGAGSGMRVNLPSGNAQEVVGHIRAPSPEPAAEEDDEDRDGAEDKEDAHSPPPLDGRLARVMQLIGARRIDDALIDAIGWRREQPGDVLALIALGEALEAKGDRPLAARAYGSLIDLFPGRADLRRFAGERLERLADTARGLAIDTYRRAVDDRPDHLTGHRLLAMALVRAGRPADAFAALERGIAQRYPEDRFRGGVRVLREDLGTVAAVWLAREPGQRGDILRRLSAAGARLATSSSLRFVLYWETDANDVDFHIRDGKGGHAWYSHKQLGSGGELYEDVTTGYGPENFTISGEPRAYPYKLKIHYYSRGPMGYGMGVLEIMRHDGKGRVTFEHRPYIVMNDHAYVDLGTIGARPAIAK